MYIIVKPISIKKIKNNHQHFFTDLFKIVLDLKKEIIGIDAELHADIEEKLLSQGSKQENLWGANIYFEKDNDYFIEYTSLINIRPAQYNKSMEIQNPNIRAQMRKIIQKLILKS